MPPIQAGALPIDLHRLVVRQAAGAPCTPRTDDVPVKAVVGPGPRASSATNARSSSTAVNMSRRSGLRASIRHIQNKGRGPQSVMRKKKQTSMMEPHSYRLKTIRC